MSVYIIEIPMENIKYLSPCYINWSMPSTEFLLYLVTAVFVIFLIMNYHKVSDDGTKQKYISTPIHIPNNNNNNNTNGGVNGNGGNYDGGSKSPTERYNNGGNNNGGVRCKTPSCHRQGRCVCGGSRINVNVHSEDYGGVGHGGYGPIDPLRKFDYDAVHDEFTPPFRRSYYDDYNYMLHPHLHPTYTRGPPGRFRKVGTLIAQGVSTNDKYKFLNMNGREKYPGRDYEYYATSTNRDLKIKFYIDTKGKAICDGDNVTIPELEGYTYLFREDEDLSPKYDPYFI